MGYTGIDRKPATEPLGVSERILNRANEINATTH